MKATPIGCRKAISTGKNGEKDRWKSTHGIKPQRKGANGSHRNKWPRSTTLLKTAHKIMEREPATSLNNNHGSWENTLNVSNPAEVFHQKFGCANSKTLKRVLDLHSTDCRQRHPDEPISPDNWKAILMVLWSV